MDNKSKDHPLDDVIWNALTGAQHRFAIGSGQVRRYLPAVAPFTAVADGSPASLDALRTLVAQHGPAAFATADALPELQGLAVVRHAMLVQMLWQGELEAAPVPEYEKLTAADVPGMLSLTAATQPGPFGPRTFELGNYIGLRVQGKLAAMAGERMRVDGYTEISAVCVDPACRGQGHATGLMKALISQIRARGDVPFLHVLKSNEGAIALYQVLGFVERCDLHLTVLDKAPA